MQSGIDAGSKFLKYAEIDTDGRIKHDIYIEHQGNPESAAAEFIKQKGKSGPENIIFTGLHGNYLAGCFKNSSVVDEITATIDALRFLEKKYRYIVNVGAASIKFIELDSEGNFASYRENSLCAAGTGSFLDEQMHRMEFNYDSLATLAFIQDSPDVATRCAVFAKSDLIHRQQEGYSREEMWSGLCRGVVITMLQTAFKGEIPSGDTLFCGGLFLNSIVRIWVKELVRNAFFLDCGHFLPAIGASISNGNSLPANIVKSHINKKNINDKIINPVLPVPRSDGALSAKHEYTSEGNEIRIYRDIKDRETVSIGIDIGSTSTKLVVIDALSKNVITDIYRKTGGNPIEAAKILFGELKNIFIGTTLNITSTGTTGSGRKLIGKIIGADLIINEITAHFKGATFFDNSIETIFEIGGQDSKYIRGYNGSVVDCNMNYVCAAGTGSFIEEQANRLGYDVRDIGDIVAGINPPHTSDRCTVFMEQDINKLLRDGFTRQDALAGVIRSICKNYLNRVVGSRPVTGKRVSFQGATARNSGLVAAFESILNREIAVSPLCHVMGAFGAALLAADKTDACKSQFKGLDVFKQEVSLRYEQCEMCSNNCKITVAGIGGTEESWGFMCGKESISGKKPAMPADHFKKVRSLIRSDEKHRIRNTPSHITLKKVGIPEALTMFTYIPLWKTFFRELGADVVLSGRSTHETKESAVSISKSDFCFPVKIGLAHMSGLLTRDDIDAVFFPSVISEKDQEDGTPRMFCPYVISFPSFVRSAPGTDSRKDIISPTIDFRCGEEIIVDELHSSLEIYGFQRGDICNAYRKALDGQRAFQASRYRHGQNILKELRNGDKAGIAIIGRPYNLYDSIINLGLNERISGKNIITFPFECLINPDDSEHDIPHMYWNYGKRILSASKTIKDIDNLYPVYFTNFSCGPDSFILSRFEEIMRGKPYLIIELDEHGSETGYLTRIEAFLDVIGEKNAAGNDPNTESNFFRTTWKKKERKLWFPYMIEYTPRLFAAAFRAWGFDAEALPLEDNAAFELGRQNIRGSECLPACTTIGAFLKKMREIDADPAGHALFMPTAQGPCRFGQYSVLHRSILDKNGYGTADIFSPTSTNSYLGMTSGLRRYLFDVMMCGDMLAKYVNHKRPYEQKSGSIDEALESILYSLEDTIENRGNLIETTGGALNTLSQVPALHNVKPLAGIVGEIYVRSNPFCNNNLVRYIEKSGGEGWLSPMSEWVIYTAWMERYLTRYHRKNFLQRKLVDMKTAYMFNRIHRFEEAMKEFIPERTEPPIERVLSRGREYVPLEFEGEVILTIGRTIVFLEDGADMVVNCAPFGCMPGNITTSMFQKIQKEFGRPVINLFYDGECDVNKIIGVYLNNIKKAVPHEMKEPV
ncbi:MAG: acyl-CoA dehydratase activase [Spirochaetes bacterium]|nr:acyl-CoA dehydratase activase [Spirochaetota bacterium]